MDTAHESHVGIPDDAKADIAKLEDLARDESLRFAIWDAIHKHVAARLAALPIPPVIEPPLLEGYSLTAVKAAARARIVNYAEIEARLHAYVRQHTDPLTGAVLDSYTVRTK